MNNIVLLIQCLLLNILPYIAIFLPPLVIAKINIGTTQQTGKFIQQTHVLSHISTVHLITINYLITWSPHIVCGAVPRSDQLIVFRDSIKEKDHTCCARAFSNI